MLNGGHIYLEGIMSSVNKNQIEVGQYLSHESTDIIIKEKVENYVD